VSNRIESAPELTELDPDVLTGWNVVDFDLRVLARRWRELGVRAPLGRSTESSSSPVYQSSIARRSSALTPAAVSSPSSVSPSSRWPR